MAFYEQGKGKIYFSIQGQGEPLLMLRGLGRSCRYWLGFEKIMAQHFRVILVDHRGIGRSTVPMNWGDGIEDLAKDCFGVLNKLKIDSCHIFGLSLGGMVAMSMAAQYPEAIKSLLIAASSSADYLGFRMHPYALKRLILAAASSNFHEILMQQVVPREILKLRRMAIERAWGDIRSSEGTPAKTIAKQILAAGRFRIAKQVNNIRAPTLILHGTEDFLVPAYNSLQLHRMIKGSSYRQINGAGHEIAIGFEDELCMLLKDFIKSPGI